MAWDGFPPEGRTLHCKACGCELSGRDGPRPAESYAGTYTGLCYTCERAGPVKTGDYDNGAERWSWPPACPSHRRDRQAFIGFPGCPDCGGRGRTWVSRADSRGGSYGRNCVRCAEQHDGPFMRHGVIRARVREIEAQVAKLSGKLKARRGAAKCPDPNEVLTGEHGPELWELAREWRGLVEEYQGGGLPMREPELLKKDSKPTDVETTRGATL